MERHKITAERAFEVLTTASQESDVKLVEVARRVVDTGTSPSGRPRAAGAETDRAAFRPRARHAAESCRTGIPARMGACVPW